EREKLERLGESLRAAGQLAHDPTWLDLQRRMAFPPGSLAHLAPPGGLQAVTGAGAPHLSGVYPPVSLPGDLIAREREKLERLGESPKAVQKLTSEGGGFAVERLSQERQAAERDQLRERERLVALSDPVARLAAAAQAQATQHAHTHTHAHSHTHLHLHQQE
ncbi:hypothetical protein EGW08_001963, partial [Elysia chlorotica]